MNAGARPAWSGGVGGTGAGDVDVGRASACGQPSNPANPATTVGFALTRDGRVRLAVHDLRGRLVCVLVDDDLTVGEHSATWNGREASGRRSASGVYMLRLETAGTVDVRRLTLVQ